MFLSGLNENQKVAFLVLAQELISADGVLADEELVMMEQYKQEMAISAPFSETPTDTAQAITVFMSAPCRAEKADYF